MGLIYNVLAIVSHLLFSCMDILMVMILVKVIYDRWQFIWLKPFFTMVQPAVKVIIDSLGTKLVKITGKPYSEKTLLLLLILCLWVIQCVVASLLR